MHDVSFVDYCCVVSGIASRGAFTLRCLRSVSPSALWKPASNSFSTYCDGFAMCFSVEVFGRNITDSNDMWPV